MNSSRSPHLGSRILRIFAYLLMGIGLLFSGLVLLMEWSGFVLTKYTLDPRVRVRNPIIADIDRELYVSAHGRILSALSGSSDDPAILRELLGDIAYVQKDSTGAINAYRRSLEFREENRVKTKLQILQNHIESQEKKDSGSLLSGESKISENPELKERLDTLLEFQRDRSNSLNLNTSTREESTRKMQMLLDNIYNTGSTTLSQDW